jgi:hypothetical protein
MNHYQLFSTILNPFVDDRSPRGLSVLSPLSASSAWGASGRQRIRRGQRLRAGHLRHATCVGHGLPRSAGPECLNIGHTAYGK